MSRITGIYQITNLHNNKSYIGQSRNIFLRWKQHTRHLDRSESEATSLIRKAFTKYGLCKGVSSIGVHAGFRFEIIEECAVEKLLEREYYHIVNRKPEYNISRMPPRADISFRVKRVPSSSDESKICLQYHNTGRLGYYPGHLYDGEESETPAMEAVHYISTKKREVMNAKGNTVLLIVGVKIGKTTDYFAWSVMVVEELECFEGENLPYNILGDQVFFRSPMRLNDLKGFREFRHRQGNFGLGFQNISDDPWIKTIRQIIERGPYITDSNISWIHWVRQFEKKNGIDSVALCA